MPKLTLEMDIDSDPQHAAEQLTDAIASLSCLRESFCDGVRPQSQSNLLVDSMDDDELIGNWRID